MAKFFLLSMYAEIFANWVSGGRLINRDKISALGLKSVYNQFITRNWITKAWCITSLPVAYDHNLQEGIQVKMREACPHVRTIIHTYNKPVNVNVNSRIYKQLMGSITSAYDEYASYFSELRDDEKLTGKTGYNPQTGRRYYINKEQLQKIKEKRDSYHYVYRAVSSGKQMFETYLFVQASAKTRRELERYGKRLVSLLQQDKICVREIKGNIGEYLSNFCPASFQRGNIKNTSSFLVGQEALAFQMPYRLKGLINSSGMLLGMDWQTRLPFVYNPLETPDGQVVLVAGRTGSGKTYTCFNIAQQGIGYGIHSSAIDFKGREWCKLAEFVDTKVISMDGADPVFVNTLRLDDLNCTKDNCKEMFSNAVTGTVMLLSLMVDLQPNEGNAVDLHTILEKATMKLYSREGVFQDNPETFSRTASMTYQDIIDIVADLESTGIYNENQVRICNLIKLRCSNYFSSDGRYSDLMRNEVTVGDILNTPLIVYSFNKNSNGELDLLDTIKVFMVQFLDSKKHEIRKQQHLHTFAFYEELQRCTSFTVLLRYISSRVTGSRSSNVSVFLLLNAISALDSDAMAQIRSNITTKIIGKVTEEDKKVLVEKFGCGAIEKYIDLIIDTSSVLYRNCFAIQYETGHNMDKALFKTILPDYMLEKLNTRDSVGM